LSGLPALRPKDVIAILSKLGYIVDHQVGSHIVMYKPGVLPITVPNHNRDLKKGTLHTIIRSAGVTPEEFVRLK
jgi:predicted RNA binding protein YcfA (HicA-like mRNA interferase family)